MIPVKPGIYPGVSEEEYFALAALGCSDMKQWVDGKRISGGRYLLIGSAFHDIIADPKGAAEKYATSDADFDLRTQGGKVALQAFEMAQGKTCIRPTEREQIKSMYRALKEHPATMPLLTAAKGDKECVCVANFDPNRPELLSKCRADFLIKKNGEYTAIVDWKTTSALSQEEFVESIVKYRYDASAAYYVDIVWKLTGQFLPFFWACVSKRSYEVWLTKMDPLMYATGRRWFQDVMKLWEREVYYAGQWAGQDPQSDGGSAGGLRGGGEEPQE